MPRIAVVIYCLMLTVLSSTRAVATPAPDTQAALLTATFETELRSRGEARRDRWTLVRWPNHLEHWFARKEGRVVDAWSRTRAEVTLTRVFPDERTVVEYTEGQLRALGNLRSWHQLSSLLPNHPAQLGLRKTGDAKVGEWTAARYEGKLGKARVVVSWLEAARLPASLTISQGQVTHTTTLLALKLKDTRRLEQSQVRQYRRIDASDLGDLEHDPFVQRHHGQLHP